MAHYRHLPAVEPWERDEPTPGYVGRHGTDAFSALARAEAHTQNIRRAVRLLSSLADRDDTARELYRALHFSGVLYDRRSPGPVLAARLIARESGQVAA